MIRSNKSVFYKYLTFENVICDEGGFFANWLKKRWVITFGYRKPHEEVFLNIF